LAAFEAGNSCLFLYCFAFFSEANVAAIIQVHKNKLAKGEAVNYPLLLQKIPKTFK